MTFSSFKNDHGKQTTNLQTGKYVWRLFETSLNFTEKNVEPVLISDRVVNPNL